MQEILDNFEFPLKQVELFQRLQFGVESMIKHIYFHQVFELVVSGGLGENLKATSFWICPRRAQRKDLPFDPSEGTLRVLKIDSLDNTIKDYMECISPEEVSSRMEAVKTQLLEEEVPLAYKIIRTEKKLLIRIMMSENPEGDLEEVLRLKSFSDERYYSFLEQQLGIYLEWGFTLHSDGSSSDELIALIPYGEKVPIEKQIETLNVLYGSLVDNSLLPSSEGSREMKLAFKHPIPDRPKAPALNVEEYEAAVESLKDSETAYSGETPATYTGFLQRDFGRVPYLSYLDACDKSRVILGKDSKELIVRTEICCFVQAQDGQWVLLLPASEPWPGETEYPVEYLDVNLHERVINTWESDGRSSLVRQLKKETEIRGFIIQKSSGRMQVFLDPDKMTEESASIQFLKDNGINFIDQRQDVFSEIVRRHHMQVMVNLNCQILLEGGTSRREVAFYRFWARRRYVENMPLESMYGDVDMRFQEMERKVQNLRWRAY